MVKVVVCHEVVLQPPADEAAAHSGYQFVVLQNELKGVDEHPDLVLTNSAAERSGVDADEHLVVE